MLRPYSRINIIEYDQVTKVILILFIDIRKSQTNTSSTYSIQFRPSHVQSKKPVSEKPSDQLALVLDVPPDKTVSAGDIYVFLVLYN